MEETKRCPYCGEEILAVAKKCKHCGEWLEAKEPEKEKKACPICGEMVDADIEVCPYCKEPTHFDNSDVDAKTYHKIEKIEDAVTNNGLKPEISILKNKSFRKIGQFVLYFAAVCVFAFCLPSIKKCTKKEPKMLGIEQANPLVKGLQERQDETLALLTKGPCSGSYSFRPIETEDEEHTQFTIVSKKTYTVKGTYTENGTIIINTTYSQSGLKWSAEGEIDFHERGDFSLIYGSDIYEDIKEFKCTNIKAKVNYNNTGTDDEDIAMNLRLFLNRLVKEMQQSEESTRYTIKTLTEKTLILEEMEDGNIRKTTSEKLTFERQ